MIAWLLLPIAFGIALPHILSLQRVAPVTAATLWAVSLVNRALMAILATLYLAFLLPATESFAAVTHWCWHTVLPVVAAHLGLEGHDVGDLATLVPGLLVTASLASVAFGVIRATRAVRRLVAREALGRGPAGSVIVPGPDVLLAAAGLTRPRLVVSAGALLELDDDELAAGLDHERGHIARHHRFLLVFAELCRGVGRFVPGSRRAVRELLFHLERDADQWALRRRHDRLALAGAICKAAGIGRRGGVATVSLAGGTRERLGQLIDEEPRRCVGVAMLVNGLAVAMVFGTFVLAALIPSTALAGAAQLRDDQPIRHCEDERMAGGHHHH